MKRNERTILSSSVAFCIIQNNFGIGYIINQDKAALYSGFEQFRAFKAWLLDLGP